LKEAAGWIAFLAGFTVGTVVGGLLIYVVIMRETRTSMKSFSYDREGRLIQVLKEYDV
jgi:uncharacterized protein (DUF2062 family)